MPAAVYPWALLVFWQLIMPGASFLGHMCGVLVGRSVNSGAEQCPSDLYMHMSNSEMPDSLCRVHRTT